MSFELIRFELLVEPKNYFRIGNRVNCILIIELNGALMCKHIYITAVGEMFARFVRQQRSSDVTHFMTVPINVRDLVRTDILQSGLYRIPFEFYLNDAYLPTFKTKNGKITYFVEAIVDKPYFSDTFNKTRQEFIVKTESNVCSQTYTGIPIASNRENLIRQFGLKQGVVRVSAHLDRNVYFSGEIIYINFHLDNRSPRSVRFMPQIIQHASFKKEFLFLENHELMASNYAEICRENSSQSDIVAISIPFDCIPTIDDQLLEIKYLIRLFVDISGAMEYFDEMSFIVK